MMKKTRRQKTLTLIKRSPFTVLYTVCFLTVCLFVFGCYFVSKRTLIWSGDGWKQHYKALVYFGKYLRSILIHLLENHRLSIPTWDFSIGEGSDILTTLHYYVMGDPLNLFAIFVPAKYMWVLYDFLVILRLYLSGLSFAALCFRTGLRNRYGVMAGAMSYAFCSWALVNAVRHPFFLNPMIALPLLILGVEEYLRRKRPLILVGAVCLSAISNVYFFYMLVLTVVFYVLVRIFVMYRTDLWKAFRALCGIALGAIAGVLLAAFVLLPMLYVFAGNDRLSVEYGFDILYPLSYYSDLPSAFLSTDNNHSLRLQCSITVVPALYLLFRKKGEYKTLKILFFMYALVILFPLLGRAFNGFSYVTNRWGWGFALLCAYVLAAMWTPMLQISKKDIQYLVICAGIHFALCTVLEYSRSTGSFVSLTLLFLIICLLLVGGGGRRTSEKPAYSDIMYYAV